jgi:hypothetical protein
MIGNKKERKSKYLGVAAGPASKGVIVERQHGHEQWQM